MDNGAVADWLAAVRFALSIITPRIDRWFELINWTVILSVHHHHQSHQQHHHYHTHGAPPFHQTSPNFSPCGSHLEGTKILAFKIRLTALHVWKRHDLSSMETRETVNSRNCTFNQMTIRVIINRLDREYLLNQPFSLRKCVCCIHVIICAKSIRHEEEEVVFYTWMLQEISESSSNRIVQSTSWSKERLLGLRNRSIFILV